MTAEQQLIMPPPIRANLSPLGFHRYASHFLAAARSAPPAHGFSPVGYYLYSRAIELVLKAFLLERGMTKAELKKRALGHDLLRVLAKADELGLATRVEVTDAEREEIRKANDYYADKEFEYFNVISAVTGYSKLPNLTVMDQLAQRLVSGLHDGCLNAQ